MPGSFKDQRERSNEKRKSKDRTEREMQWGSKVKGSSVLQNISKEMASPQKCCVKSLLFTGGQGQTISPGPEQRHFSLQSSRGAVSSRNAMKYDCNNKSKFRETVSNMESELTSCQTQS